MGEANSSTEKFAGKIAHSTSDKMDIVRSHDFSISMKAGKNIVPKVRRINDGGNDDNSGSAIKTIKKDIVCQDIGRKLANIQSENTANVSLSSTKPPNLHATIYRLKNKLAKFHITGREANEQFLNKSKPQSVVGAVSRNPRTSERSSIQNDCSSNRQPTRSMSFSASSQSDSLPVRERLAIVDQDYIEKISSQNGQGSSINQHKRGQRGRKKNERKSIWNQFYARQSLKEKDKFLYDSLSFFLLDLLFVSESEREELIVAEAQRREILVAESNYWKLNPQLTKWHVSPFRNVYLDVPVNYASRKLAGKPFVTCLVKHRPVVGFEDLVNDVICVGLPFKQQKQFSLPVPPAQNRKANYFKENEFEENLEVFAQKCVEANLGIIIEGEIRISAKNNDHGFIRVPDCDRDAMIASQLSRKFALHGDVVRAFVRNVVEEKPAERLDVADDSDVPLLDENLEQFIAEPLVTQCSRAFVIRIVKAINNRLIVGTFLSYRKTSPFITFVPRDMRMPNIHIYEEFWPESFKDGNLQTISDILYVAEIIQWRNEECIGKIVQTIGKCGELDAENRAILLKNNLQFEPFDDKLSEIYASGWTIPKADLKMREDLRSECIFTIDPVSAKDLDDALSIKELFDGSFEIGVHISDVAYFLAEESELDQLVKKRTTSVYMVNEVFHMLPKALCLQCSLSPDHDKLAVSVFWRLSSNAEIMSTRFVRTVIRSCSQLTYQHAQMILNNPNMDFVDNDFPQIHNGFTVSDIVRCVKQLNSVATILRTKRFDNGALKIDRPKIYFDLDPQTGEPTGFKKLEQLEANFLIEEFMLLANQSVASFIFDKFPKISILRNHQPPLKNILKRVKDGLQTAGMILNVSSSKSIYSSLTRLIANSENPETASVCLSQLISKPMTRARYFCSDDVEYAKFNHYALSVPIYTHFTSPIRRYPDVLVHRVLVAALGYVAVPKRSPTELKILTEYCNDGKYNAKLAADDSSNLYFFQYVQSKGPLVMLGVVIEMYSHSFDATLVESGIVISVSTRKRKGATCSTRKSSNGSLETEIRFSRVNKSVVVKLCSEVWLEVTTKLKQLKAEVVPPPIGGAVHLCANKMTDVACGKKVSEKKEAVETDQFKNIGHVLITDESEVPGVQENNEVSSMPPLSPSTLVSKDERGDLNLGRKSMEQIVMNKSITLASLLGIQPRFATSAEESSNETSMPRPSKIEASEIKVILERSNNETNSLEEHTEKGNAAKDDYAKNVEKNKTDDKALVRRTENDNFSEKIDPNENFSHNGEGVTQNKRKKSLDNEVFKKNIDICIPFDISFVKPNIKDDTNVNIFDKDNEGKKSVCEKGNRQEGCEKSKSLQPDADIIIEVEEETSPALMISKASSTIIHPLETIRTNEKISHSSQNTTNLEITVPVFEMTRTYRSPESSRRTDIQTLVEKSANQ